MAADDDKQSSEAAKDSTAAQPSATPEGASAPGTTPIVAPVPLPGVPLPPGPSRPTDTAHGDAEDSATSPALEQMQQAVEEQKKDLEELGDKIQEAKEHEKQMRTD